MFFIRKKYRHSPSKKRSRNVSAIIIACFGLLTTCLSMIVTKVYGLSHIKGNRKTNDAIETNVYLMSVLYYILCPKLKLLIKQFSILENYLSMLFTLRYGTYIKRKAINITMYVMTKRGK